MPEPLPAAAFATIAIVVLATPALADQTFPDPFGGEGIHSDIRAGSRGEDIGDAFFMREGAVLSIRMFLDAPNTFIESHVCLSGEPFTRRIPPGQCQFQATGGAAGSYDIALPPDSFPLGNVPFDDPLGAFCAQVHVKYSSPGSPSRASAAAVPSPGGSPGVRSSAASASRRSPTQSRPERERRR